MFKIGERVVFVGTNRPPRFNGFKRPEVGEVVTIHSYNATEGAYHVDGYLHDNNGLQQCFKPDTLRKLDTPWAEKVLAEVLESELVLIEG